MGRFRVLDWNRFSTRKGYLAFRYMEMGLTMDQTALRAIAKSNPAQI